MPNWCICRLSITGAPDDRKAFLDACYVERPPSATDDESAVARQVLKIQESLLPMPTALEGTSSPAPLYYDAVYESPERVDEILRYPWVQEAGVHTQQQLIDFLAAKRPEEVAEAAKNRDCFEKYGVTSWYEWMIKNWGCKWGDGTTVVEEDEDVLVLSFDTPWNPPIEGISTISGRFPDLTFQLEYQEDGERLDGGCLIKNGTVRQSWANEYTEFEDEFTEFEDE